MNEPLNIILWGVAIFVVLMLLSYLLPILLLGIIGIANVFMLTKEHLTHRKKYKKAVKQTRNKQKEFEERKKRQLENMKLEREKFDSTKERVESELNKHF